MKIVFFLLVLANAALFMWEYRKGALSSEFGTPVQHTDDYREQIVLVSELPADIQKTGRTGINPASEEDSPAAAITEVAPTKKPGANQTLAAQANEPAVSASEEAAAETTQSGSANMAADQSGAETVMCLDAGPFASKSDYKVWESRLSGFIRPVDKDAAVAGDFLVYYPAGETIEQSKANVRMLKDKGVNDLWMINQGAEQGQISLGVFNKEEKAQLMKNDLLAKGINAEVRARSKTKVQLFAVIKAENTVLDKLEDLKKDYPKVMVKQRNADDSDRCF